MVVNQVSMKTENERITSIIKKFQAYLKENAGR
jgi:ATP phosphoribosyltransferase